MKLKHLVITGISALSFCGFMAISNLTANAKTIHYYTPKSWRGTYYAPNGSEMKVNTYSVSYNGKTFYKSSWSGWKKLAFSKVTKATYTFNALAKYGFQSSRMWKMKHKNGKTYLVNYKIMGEVTYWKKYVKPKPLKGYTVADSDDFFYNAWRRAYLDMYTDEADLYKNFNDAKDSLEEPDYKLTNYKKKVYAKWPSADSPYDVILVKVDGKTYYLNDSLHDIRPYNASRSGSDGIFSKFKPTDKNVVLKHGTKVYKNTEWYLDSGKGFTYKNTGKNYHSWKFEY
ncbi:hypothetical protein FC56_GL000239 [Lentilactobacillus senioris DSM 24302 = JCM 17472]|uniref:Surface layer protein A domain-containing protein n=1 Tax=Lentilactobacillus senioris DSM 24302 = JCM 17472 TaxID=1423802 RepID=A0A0R2CPQ2_9LACO|nr:hypothetical protein [Lentilactobacillus senioris]KRM93527.1 hypothetical protein FC56_GL000239 [Lentilactobacillus senioris DSM 24302 = JCM 17472]